MQNIVKRKTNFNPRSREGSDKKVVAIRWNDNRFQSTLPRRERLEVFTRHTQKMHFNPRSREGSDASANVVINVYVISIHAPAKGATGHKVTLVICPEDFNPRSREGSDCRLARIG